MSLATARGRATTGSATRCVHAAWAYMKGPGRSGCAPYPGPLPRLRIRLGRPSCRRYGEGLEVLARLLQRHIRRGHDHIGWHQLFYRHQLAALADVVGECGE